jgi:hypothetical protein
MPACGREEGGRGPHHRRSENVEAWAIPFARDMNSARFSAGSQQSEQSSRHYQAEYRRLSERLGDELVELAATIVSDHVDRSRVARAEVHDE